MQTKHILVVDDEPLVLKAVQTVLSGHGHTVETAGEAEAALRTFDSNEFDVVVTDLRLAAGMQGDKLAQEIKRRKPSQTIFMLTAFPPAARPEGCDLVLRKPSGLAELCRLISELASEEG